MEIGSEGGWRAPPLNATVEGETTLTASRPTGGDSGRSAADAAEPRRSVAHLDTRLSPEGQAEQRDLR